MGSDSRSFVDTANQILNHFRNHKGHRRPWKLVSDGDLWEHFYNAAQAKGPLSIKLTCVKGNAEPKHIDDEIITEIDEIGNDKADVIADIGTALHGESVLLAAKRLHYRHARYQTFMTDVSRHIVEAYLIHRELTDRIVEEEIASHRYHDKEAPQCP